MTMQFACGGAVDTSHGLRVAFNDSSVHMSILSRLSHLVVRHLQQMEVK